MLRVVGVGLTGVLVLPVLGVRILNFEVARQV